MTDIATTFTVHFTTEGRGIDVVVGLNASERRVWGYYEAVPWMKLSDYISKGTVTQNRTVDGQQIIVNWGSLQVISYENPWEGIDSDHAVKETAE